ncbi:MAG: hypothetical protein HRK26_02230 [Rickettsiaceae bacterium H1]|nr:hypothetical protein [Rickettsiaceae bacterium H1]
MIKEVLQLISIFDTQIELLKKKQIKEILPWQNLENKLILQLEKNQKKVNLPKNLYKIFNTKLKQKHYLIEHQLSMSKKLLGVLRKDVNIYNNIGNMEDKNFIAITDKRI